jgi:hypothetical protein
MFYDLVINRMEFKTISMIIIVVKQLFILNRKRTETGFSYYIISFIEVKKFFISRIHSEVYYPVYKKFINSIEISLRISQ